MIRDWNNDVAVVKVVHMVISEVPAPTLRRGDSFAAYPFFQV
jgi:hypothetical protein